MSEENTAKVAVGALQVNDPGEEEPMSVRANGTSNGEPDPTKNVLDLVEAAIKRIDDMAEERQSTLDSKLKRLDDMRDMRADGLHEIILLDRSHQKDMDNVRANYEQLLRNKEAERIDAIRAVDVQAVQRTSEVQAAQQQALATQAQVNADTLRNQVATVAQAQNTSLAAALEPIQKDISELRKTQYEQQGQKAQQIENRQSTVQDRGQSQWIIGTAIGLLTFVAGIVIAFLLRGVGG